MTEPTAEQVDAIRPIAHSFCEECIGYFTIGGSSHHMDQCTTLAIALARFRIEAHADVADDLREASENVDRMRARNLELIAAVDRLENERAEWTKQRVDIGIKFDLYRLNHEPGEGCAKAHAAGRDEALREGEDSERYVANSLSEMMSKRAIGSPERMELSLRAGERYESAKAIRALRGVKP